MINKSILAAGAIAATVGIVAPASADFLETGTVANNAEGGLASGGYDWRTPHSQKIFINRWPVHQRRE